MSPGGAAPGPAVAALAAAAAALGCLAAWALGRLRAERRASRDARAELGRARARATVAMQARAALAQEAAHVIGARIRETARALDRATDPRASPAERDAALRRVGASLSQAEAEAAALLDPSPHTRIARAEDDAAIDLLYATTVLEFDGGLSVRADRPVPHGALARVQHALRRTDFAVITSDNPMSARETDEANALRRGVLGTHLRGAGILHVPVAGRSPDGSWREHGFAVAADVDEADAIAEQCAQRAYFWFDGQSLWVHELTGRRRRIALPDPRTAG